MKIIRMSTELIANTTDSAVTKLVKMDFNRLTNQEFMNKYAVSKMIYFKRVLKYGDPYMRAPLAKLGKLLVRRR